MPANELPPLDECLSAMDERIEFLSSALSSLSEELTSRKPSSSSSAANPLAVELARVKAKLKEAEAKLASNASGGGEAALREQVALLERENAAVLNACVQPMAQRTVAGLRDSLRQLELSCPLYLTQNDGTAASTEIVERFPIGSFLSGPTNSMRGASLISGQMDALVVDVGGTTTDIGLLVGGFPRQAGMGAKIGGVQTNYPVPDTISIGLGGGSRVRSNIVGPDSVGYRLTTEARCFGGTVTTATPAVTVRNTPTHTTGAHVVCLLLILKTTALSLARACSLLGVRQALKRWRPTR